MGAALILSSHSEYGTELEGSVLVLMVAWNASLIVSTLTRLGVLELITVAADPTSCGANRQRRTQNSRTSSCYFPACNSQYFPGGNSIRCSWNPHIANHDVNSPVSILVTIHLPDPSEIGDVQQNAFVSNCLGPAYTTCSSACRGRK